MKIWVLSDLHIDRNPDLDLGPHPECEVIAMAGDLCDGGFDPTPWLLGEFSDDERARMIFVPGNHEYYDIGTAAGEVRVRQLQADTGIILLQRDTVEVDGVRFVGCTMWSPLEERLDHLGGDLISIPNFSGPIWRQMHQRDAAWLGMTVQEGDVVITHHAPGWDGLKVDMQHNVRLMSLASGYMARMESLIEETQPALWIHGHTHVTREYEIAGCRVVTNALGRGHNPSFQPGYVVELGGYQPKPPGW